MFFFLVGELGFIFCIFFIFFSVWFCIWNIISVLFMFFRWMNGLGIKWDDICESIEEGGW